MSQNNQLVTSVVAVSIWLFTQSVFALPSLQSSEGSNEDSTVYITVQDEVILGDAKSYCSIRLKVTSESDPLVSGDTAILTVYEYDGALGGDEQLWSKEIQFDSSNIQNGVYDETFDCSTSFGESDPGDEFEIYGWAKVMKEDESGCCERYDRPDTKSLDVLQVNDDDREPDNSSDSATQITVGPSVASGISKNQDWFQFSLSNRKNVTGIVKHRPRAGRLEVTLLDSSLSPIDTGVKHQSDRSLFEDVNLSPEDDPYYMRVNPRMGSNPNFYDIGLVYESPDSDSCEPGVTESRPCGNCGTQTRECPSSGVWGEWGECTDQGPCQEGETRKQSCSKCGVRTDTCNSSCEWEKGECTNQGECVAGTTETQECEQPGVKKRICTEECQWSDFEECVAQNQPLGEGCENDEECGQNLECLGEPEEPMFKSGYCGKTGCETDADCPDSGVCVENFGKKYCLLECENKGECRPFDYLCLDYDRAKACTPACTSDEHCRSVERVCDELTGKCVAEDSQQKQSDAEVDEYPSFDNDSGGGGFGSFDSGSSNNNSPQSAPEPGCGCSSRAGGWSGGFSMILVLLVIFGRRVVSKNEKT